MENTVDNVFCRLFGSMSDLLQRLLSPVVEFSEVAAGQVPGVQRSGFPDRYAGQLCQCGQAVPGIRFCRIVRNCAAAAMQENLNNTSLICWFGIC